MQTRTQNLYNTNVDHAVNVCQQNVVQLYFTTVQIAFNCNCNCSSYQL